MARLGLDTSGWKKDLDRSTADLQGAINKQAQAVDRGAGLTLNSNMKVKRAIKSLGEDVLAGAGPVQLLTDGLMKMSMLFKGGLKFAVGTTIAALIGKECYDAWKEARDLNDALADLGRPMSVDFSSIDALQARIQKLQETVKGANKTLNDDSLFGAPAQMSVVDQFYNAWQFASHPIDAFKGRVKWSDTYGDMLRMTDKDNALSKFQGEVTQKLQEEAARKQAASFDRRGNFLNNNRGQDEIDAVYEALDKSGRDIKEKKGAALQDVSLSSKDRRARVDALESEWQTAVRDAELQLAKIVEERKDAVDDAKDELRIMQERLAGHTTLAERLEIEKKYQGQILKAQRDGNKELAETLQKQQQLEISAKGYANWKQTPEQRQQRRQQERQEQRDSARHDREKAQVERDMDNGETIGDGGRRGDLKREIENGRIAEENKRRADAGQEPMTPEEAKEFTKPKSKPWYEQGGKIKSKSESEFKWDEPNWGNGSWHSQKSVKDRAGALGSDKPAVAKADAKSPLSQIAQDVAAIKNNVGINK